MEGSEYIILNKQQVFFYCSAHVGVLYNMNTRHQRQLLGHCNVSTEIMVDGDSNSRGSQ